MLGGVLLPTWRWSRGEGMPRMAGQPSLLDAMGGRGLWGGGCGSAGVEGDSRCSPQDMQAGPYSLPACPYRLWAVWVLVGVAEEKGRPLAHETHLVVCGFRGHGVGTPSSKGAAMGGGGWVLPELL